MSGYRTKAIISYRKIKAEPGVLVCASNPSYTVSRDERISIQGQPGQKVSKPLLQTNKPGLMMHT
jgi:hypothetical protein